MADTPIKVLLVDDSPVALAVMKKLLSSSSEVEVVGTAKDGKEALGLIPAVNPAVVCTDLEMPVMNGLELTKAIMTQCPRPVLVISSLVHGEHMNNVFQLLEAGAIDVLPKPRGGIHADTRLNAIELIGKIKVLSGVIPFRRRPDSAKVSPAARRDGRLSKAIRMLGLGASVGGPQALLEVLRALPASFPVPILCVQHIGIGFLQGLVDWLGHHSKLKIKIAEPGEQAMPGTVYFPQENTHLALEYDGRLSSSQDAPIDGHRPSVTVTFKSIAAHYGSGAAGVLLTGMGEDGAYGMKAIADAGGLTIAQDEQTSIVFGMPRHAIEMGAARYVLPIGQVARTVLAEIERSPERL